MPKKKLDKLTKKRVRKYLKSDGSHCPFCWSEHITADELVGDGPTLRSKVICVTCRREWIDRFDLSGIEEADELTTSVDLSWDPGQLVKQPEQLAGKAM